ncbi:hypothetical protein PTTG_27446 [Puccinia triticina 1-1 BBBD Race 1]|uniref:Polar growth protein n=1 Tax=Puccinia triticina (isolate 1-1 / race 1 (BBBD)) TaxID=630390 RepID=A0A180GK19_PUCT1|nr:hypothetical protein PTTG_27446 [Puccinia triticina 1-1 BBBD Race 1]
MAKPHPIVYAIHDFQAENPDELSFTAGEAIEVTEKDDLYGDGWWQGRNTKGQHGLFPQAYTLPAEAVLKPTPQLTMNETLFEVQNAIDQLHHPSSSSSSLPPPTPTTADSSASQQQQQQQHSDEADEPTHFSLHSNPAKARAILAQKAQANASSAAAMPPTSLNSLISIPGIGDMELSEESGAETDDDDHEPNSTHNKKSCRSRSSTLAGKQQPKNNNNNNNNNNTQPSGSPTTHPTAPKLSTQPSSESTRQPTAFKPGPFSAAAMALGLTGSPKEKDKPPFTKGHQPQKPSSSSILSDLALDLRDHFNLASAPVASTLRMSRESSQFTNLPTFSDLNNTRPPNSAPSDGFRPPVYLHPTPTTLLSSAAASAPDHQQPPSPQEHLSEKVAVSTTRNSLTTRSQENLNATPSNSNHHNHQRQASACSTGSGIFLHQQLSQLPQPVLLQDTKTSISTADSSSAKDSRSRSSSRVEQFISIEDQPTSPATSTFPSSAGGAGARPGDGSLSSSQSRSLKPLGFASFSSASPDQWSVAEVSEWAKLKGLDEFTVGKFVEHEITGDVLLELDVNALKEIELTAFGRRVRVIKAIEELKKNLLHHKQSHPLSPLSDPIHLTSSSIDSSLHPSPLANPRTELAHQHHHHHHHQAGRLSLTAKHDHSTFPYQKAYLPQTADASDREEELAQHASSRDSTSKASALQSHNKRPSDASGFSSHRRQENENSNSSRDELVPSSNQLPPGYKRTSSASGRPRQATFSNHDSPQSNHQRNQSKATVDSTRRSRASSWTPVTEAHDENDATGPVKDQTGTLEGPIVLDSPEIPADEKPKKVKKKKLGIQKPPATTTAVSSLKTKKNSIESPDRRPISPDTPDKSQHDPPTTNTKSRTSFLGNLRVRKPPPKLSSQSPVSVTASNNNGEGEGRPSSSSGNPSSMNGRHHGRSLFHFGSGGGSGSGGGQEKVQGQTQHQIQHLSPLAESKHAISSPIPLDETKEDAEAEAGLAEGGKRDGETRTALERIGSPDHMGWMRKKGEKYPTWKLRYFILKGPNLYYLKAQNEVRIKGLIKLAGFKVVMDADVHPGRYGFRIIHDNGATHLFSADDSKLLRDWMKAMMKATIDRDWIAPVISSCNIRTIPIKEAQKMFPPPRPPSPLSRARVQKARLAANPDVLSEKDAAVLMGLQSPAHRLAAAAESPKSPGDHNLNDLQLGAALRPRRSTQRPSPSKAGAESPEELSASDRELLGWINDKIRARTSATASDFSGSIRNGHVLVRLIEALTRADSGLSDRDFLGASHLTQLDLHRPSLVLKDDDFDVFFAIFDFLNSQNIPLAGYSLNDLISGDPDKTRDFLMRVYLRFQG